MTETVSQASADIPQETPRSEALPEQRSPLLTPPPVAKLQRAHKAELLPPPPGVVSKRDRPAPVQSPIPGQEPAAVAQSAAQSSIEQGHMMGQPAEHQDSQAQPQSPEDETPRSVETSSVETGAVEDTVPEASTPDTPHAGFEAASDFRKQAPAFDSALVPETETGSKGRGMWLAIAGILLLAALTWWQLGS